MKRLYFLLMMIMFLCSCSNETLYEKAIDNVVEIICDGDINKSYNYNCFENGLTWETIPKPGEENEKDSHFSFAGYRVSKGSSKGVLT